MDNVVVYCDGGSRGNPGKSASAFVVTIKGKVIHKGSVFLGVSTNNVAEYSAVILALKWIVKNLSGISNEVTLILDSELVVRQLNGFYKVKNNKLKILFSTIKDIENKITAHINYTSVSREKNYLADSLVNQVLDKN
ncbi:MAG: ribonuclease HI family protein [bacterium]